MSKITDAQIEQIGRIFKRNGNAPKHVRGVAKQYGITEALSAKLGKLFTETAPTRPITETTPTVRDSREVRETFLAEQLASEVRATEGRPLNELSTQSLEALAAASWV